MATVNITGKTFSETVAKGIVVLDWWAPWCAPCRAFAPIYERAATEHTDVVFGKINTEEESELSGAFQIRSIPTLMMFRDGILLFNQPGMVGAEDITYLLDQARKLDMDEVRRKITEAHQATPNDNKNGAPDPA